MNLNQLYQDVIIDHNNNPRNYAVMDDACLSADGFNPLCGDKVTLYLKLENDKISAASFQGCGCAISTASASMMTEYLIGKSRTEAEALFQQFQAAVTGDETTIELGKLDALTGVREFPSRVKCATLAWHTLLAALKQESQAVSTE